MFADCSVGAVAVPIKDAASCYSVVQIGEHDARASNGKRLNHVA